MSRCNGCQADILWIKSKSGKMMPADIKKKTVITPDGEIISGHAPHFSTCPEAEKFRKDDRKQ